MQNISRRTTIRFAACAVIALSMAAMVARADSVQPTPSLPPTEGVYVIGPTCITQVCLSNITIGDFQGTTTTFLNGNQAVDTGAVFSADIYQNNGGSHGAFLGSLSTLGSLDLIYFGRVFDSELGTFNAQITNFDFLGMFNGHTFELQQNPNQMSTGQTTIETDLGAYRVISFFDVYAEVSIDGGSFVAGPVQQANLVQPVPEPSALILLLTTLPAVAFVVRNELPSIVVPTSGKVD